MTFLLTENVVCINRYILIHYSGLQCPNYCKGWFSQCTHVESIIQLPYFHGLFLLIRLHAHASVLYPFMR
jgi:hypothetical protein